MKELNNYFREITGALPCTGCKKRKILRDLRLSVDGFLEEHPDATLEAVAEHFGTPQQIADSYTEEMPPRELQRQMKIKKWIIGIVAGAVVCALLMWGIAIGIALIDQYKHTRGQLVEDPIVIEELE